ncbi:MAG TPA: DNA gyrase modulator, partial [Candidatus Fermentibacter sp.]|nr:DNA gyrase modulator [Candidatus Fermentibacter sp.]
MELLERMKAGISGNIARMAAAGAEYSDARFFADDRSETLVLYDGNLEGNDTTFQTGTGVRVLWGGAWGFSASSDPEM